MQGVSSAISVAPAHPSLTAIRKSGCIKTRTTWRVSGVSPPVELYGFNNDLNTLERAVKERVFYVKKDGLFVEPPRPEPYHFERSLRDVHARLVALLPCTAPLSGQQFVDTFRGRRRIVYQRAYESLLERGVSFKDARVKVFVKYEKTNYTQKADPVPRVISPRDPRYNVELGSFLRPLEEKIFKRLAVLYGHTTVMKGMNASVSGHVMFQKWNMFNKPVAVGLDASRFDQHVSRDALEWEHSIYLACCRTKKQRKKLASLLRWQLSNDCTGYVPDGKVKYHTVGGRMSGDMNTSLGNCILMCCMIMAYSESCGVKLQLANNGDDCVVFMEQCDLARFSSGLDSWFLAMGFNMVVEQPCYTFEEIEFCQTHPVYVGPNWDDYIMVRHPKWGIAKDTCCIHNFDTEKMFRGWMSAVGVGGMAMTGGVPIFQDFYHYMISNGKYWDKAGDGQSWGVRKLGEGLTRSYGEISPATRASFYWAFGVTPDEQLCIERYYRSLKFKYVVGRQLEFQTPMPI